ncbi:MAG: hypothetical protein KA436_03645 [Oligoflexales bacterium]|nr:hypothetical protein [Oligoflexales bacterium]
MLDFIKKNSIKMFGSRIFHPFVLYLVLATCFCFPLFHKGLHTLATNDWDPHFLYYGSVVKSIFEYTQFPFWNPWHCGGNVLWQNPQVAAFSPIYLLSGFFSLAFAMKINVLLHYWISLLGMHVLLQRIFSIQFLPLTIYLACLYTFCGALSLHIGEGHTTFLPFFYTPWVFFFFLKNLQKFHLKSLFFVSFILALTFYTGGLHVLLITGCLLTLISVFYAFFKRTWKPLIHLTLISVLSVLYSAPKLIPVSFFLNSPRVFDDRMGTIAKEVISESLQFKILLDPFSNKETNHNLFYGWQEYGNYIGGFGLVLILSSLFWVLCVMSLRKQHPFKIRSHSFIYSLGLSAFIFLLLARGDFSFLAPYSLLKMLPIFGKIRCAGRFIIPFTLAASLLVAWVFEKIYSDHNSDISTKNYFKNNLKSFFTIVLAFASLDLIYFNHRHFREIFWQDPIKTDFHFFKSQNKYEVIGKDYDYSAHFPSQMYAAMMNNQSFLNCYEPLKIRPTTKIDRPLIYSDEPHVQISNLIFSPNKISANIKASDSANIFLNQNYIDGWISDAGDIQIGVAGPFIQIKPGFDARLTFSFSPQGWGYGKLLFVCGILLSLWIYRRERKNINLTIQ